jgi:hypothetical protein
VPDWCRRLFRRLRSCSTTLFDGGVGTRTANLPQSLALCQQCTQVLNIPRKENGLLGTSLEAFWRCNRETEPYAVSTVFGLHVRRPTCPSSRRCQGITRCSRSCYTLSKFDSLLLDLAHNNCEVAIDRKHTLDLNLSISSFRGRFADKDATDMRPQARLWRILELTSLLQWDPSHPCERQQRGSA